MKYIVWVSLGGEREGQYSGIVHTSHEEALKEMYEARQNPCVVFAWLQETE